MRTRRGRATRPWHLYVIVLGVAALITLGVTAIGPPAGGSRTSTELVSAADGVVQSTVSGTGNVEAGTDVAVNFQTSGTLYQVFVKVGQHVGRGQLLAELDPTAAQLGVDQAQASLTSAQDQLNSLETAAAGTTTGTTASTPVVARTEFVSAVITRPKNTGSGSNPSGTHTQTTPTTTSTTPTSTTPAPTTRSRTSTTSTSTTPPRSSGGNSTSGTGTTSTQSTPPSPASIASAQAAVDSAEVAVRSAEDTLSKTKLYVPAAGTVVSLATTTPGDTISAGSTGTPSASSGSGAASGAGGSGGGGAGTGSSSTGAGSGTGSSSSPFAEIVDSSTMTMTVSFSESDITKVHVGQPATVSIDALSGVELAAHVASISTLGTSSNGVVSYDATLQLDQTDSRVRPGMSATASVIVAQAQGVTVPLQALSGSGSLATVNVMRSGKAASQQVVVGVRGDTRAQIVSGLSAGQQLVITITLPSLGTSAGTSGNGVLGGGRLGGGGLGGLGGGGAFFRGGGGFGGGRGG